MAKFAALVVLGALSLALTTSLVAAPSFAVSPGTMGQPDQSCQSVFPSGPLSPQGFNTAGFANAGNVYAGSGQNTQTPSNSHAVSQYDVACFEVAQH